MGNVTASGDDAVAIPRRFAKPTAHMAFFLLDSDLRRATAIVDAEYHDHTAFDPASEYETFCPKLEIGWRLIGTYRSEACLDPDTACLETMADADADHTERID